MGFSGSGKNSYTTLEKRDISSVSSAGQLFEISANQINSIRLGIASSHSSNIVTLEGTVNGSAWKVIGSVAGDGIILYDTQAYDRIRAIVTTYGGTPFNFSWKTEDNPAATFIQDKSGNQLVVNSDGSINSVITGVTIENVYVDLTAFGSTPDSVLSVGSEDGTTSGIRHVVKVKSDGTTLVEDILGAKEDKQDTQITQLDDIIDNQDTQITQLNDIETKIDTTNTSLASIDAGIPASLGQQTMAASMPVVFASDQSPIPIALTDEPVKISGTENGQPNGTEFTFVNNLRSQILAAKDRDQAITYADFGTTNQRVTRIDYTASSIGSGTGFTARKTLTYTLVGNRYRRDNITWTLV